MAWKRSRGEEAVSPVIATIILVAIAIVGSGVLYSSVSRPSTDAAALAVTAAPPDRVDERTFLVSAATPTLKWGRLTLLLNGEGLDYDASLASEGSWCVLAIGTACAAQDADAGVAGGQKLRVHHADVAGGKLEIVDHDANMVLARLNLRE